MQETAGQLARLGGESMGTTWSLTVPDSRRLDLNALHRLVQTQLDLVVRQMSTWEPESDLCRFNSAIAGTWVRLPPELLFVVDRAIRTARETDGAFDPTVGPLVSLWGFGANAGTDWREPTFAQLQDARARCGWSRLQLDISGGLLYQPGGIELDLSGIAKGYAIDRVLDRLQQHGHDDALFEAGGELAAIGKKPDGSAWRVLLESFSEENATHDDSESCIIDLDGMAVATSGDRYHRNIMHGGNDFVSHSLDPRSGVPVTSRVASVSVIGASAMQADAWSTALTVMGPEQGLEYAQQHGIAVRYLCRDRSGLAEFRSSALAGYLAS